MRKITHITVHHSGTPGRRTTAANMRAYHIGERGWRDLAYHLVIEWDGAVRPGRNLSLDPDSHTDMDLRGHLFVCVVGNFEEERPTPKQVTALAAIVAALSWQFPNARIGHHGEYARTTCPGRYLLDHLPRRTL